LVWFGLVWFGLLWRVTLGRDKYIFWKAQSQAKRPKFAEPDGRIRPVTWLNAERDASPIGAKLRIVECRMCRCGIFS